MTNATLSTAINLVGNAAHPLTGSPADYDPLLNIIGGARFVLLGAASHGTHEFYQERAEITKRLICEKGFNGIVVEADWPDAYRVNRYIQGYGSDSNAVQALSGFQRFPAWMWRNADVLDFVGWLRAYNDSLGLQSSAKVGFFGLDLYNLRASIEAVLTYLDKVDPEAAARARYRYAGFDHFGEDPQASGYSAGFGLSHNCESEVVAQLMDLRSRAAEYARKDGSIAGENFFSAEQNARLIKTAEHYYRTMLGAHVSSWNLRDEHMAGTLEALVAHLHSREKPVKLVVWAHNSHVGDGRATEMYILGERNLGHLLRQRYGHDCRLIGFSTYGGTVTAASYWDGPAGHMQLRPARPDSCQGLLHNVNIPAFFVTLEAGAPINRVLSEHMLERAIGVIYRPQTELVSNYFDACLSDEFDALIHVDQTRAVESLESTDEIQDGEPAETFPSGV